MASYVYQYNTNYLYCNLEICNPTIDILNAVSFTEIVNKTIRILKKFREMKSKSKSADSDMHILKKKINKLKKMKEKRKKQA